MLIAPYLVASFLWAGCNRSSASKSTPNPTLTVEELLANPQSHSHTMVKVSGCYVMILEVSVLHSCGREFLDRPFGQLIWVESAEDVEAIEQVRERAQVRTMEKLRKNPAAGKFLFAYDKGRDSRAWQKLEPSTSNPSGVVLLGQFETEAQVPEPMRFGFGHLGAYTHELILVDVLRSETPPKR
jgi:hypothetical protein